MKLILKPNGGFSLPRNLKVLGIIAEYNPFHKGHLWQLKTAKRIINPDLTVIILGGNYSQRGEMSVLRREDKVRLALRYGADLVVGIPFYANIQAVEQFAMGSVLTAQKIGITHLVFGSEEPDFPYQKKAREFLNSPIASNPTLGLQNENYANNLAKDFSKFSISLQKANHLLGFYYALSAEKLNYQLNLIPLARKEMGYSSSMVRELLKKSDFKMINEIVPYDSREFLSQKSVLNFERTWPIVKGRLILENRKSLAETFLLPHELLMRAFRVALEVNSYEDFIKGLKTKRYTLTRIKRIYLYLLLGIKHKAADDLQAVEVWGFNKIGQKYLSSIKKKTDLITNPRAEDYQNFKSLKFEAQANLFYDYIMETSPSRFIIERNNDEIKF